MKKTYLTVGLILTIAASLSLSSCIGSFSLTKKLMTWNQTVSNKFVNELIFFAFWVLPVYEVTAMADVLVLNSIEFWSGNNPMAKGTKVIDGRVGRYLVECDGRGYTITSENDGTVTRLDFDTADRSWSVVDNEGHSVKLMSFVDDEHVNILNGRGGYDVVELSDAGVYAYQTSVASAMMLAAK